MNILVKKAQQIKQNVMENTDNRDNNGNGVVE